MAEKMLFIDESGVSRGDLQNQPWLVLAAIEFPVERIDEACSYVSKVITRRVSGITLKGEYFERNV